VFTVSNEEDRAVPSFDDLFEDPDEIAASANAQTPSSGQPSKVDSAESQWLDDVDIPDFVTADEPPQSGSEISREMSNVNVIEAISPVTEPTEDVYSDEIPEASEVGGPEFVPPLHEFGTGANVASTPAQTGRLYRSAGAEGPAAAAAIPALELVSAQVESMGVSTGQAAPAARPISDPRTTPATYHQPTPLDIDESGDAYAIDLDSSDVAKPTRSPRASLNPAAHRAGLTYSGAAVVILAATVLVGFIDALLNHHLGWLTGIALVASTIYAALNVRLSDVWAPAILAPLGFLVATLTAGQLTLGSSGSWFVREGYMIFRSLAINAPWIIGATVIGAGIALWRRRQA